MKISIRTLVILISSLFSVLGITFLTLGGLGVGNVILSMSIFLEVILLVFGSIFIALILCLLISKFILRSKYKSLSDDEVSNYNANRQLPIPLALYIYTNPSLANKQGFNFGSIRIV